jgi:hypothetical protein
MPECDNWIASFSKECVPDDELFGSGSHGQWARVAKVTEKAPLSVTFVTVRSFVEGVTGALRGSKSAPRGEFGGIVGIFDQPRAPIAAHKKGPLSG